MSRQRQNHNQAKALMDAWDIVTRYRWQFIVPAFLVCAGVLAASLLLPRKYKAEAIFERRTDSVLEEITSRGGSKSYEGPRASLVHEIAGEPAIDELLETSRDEILQIAQEQNTRVDLATLRSELLGKTLVRRDIGTSTLDRVRVSFTGADAQIARLGVNRLVTNYINRTRTDLDRRLHQSMTFFDNEVGRSRARIEELENRRLTFEIKHAELLPDNPNNVQSTLTEAQLQFNELTEQRDAALLKARALRRALDSTPDTTPSYTTRRNPELERLEQKYAQQQELLNTYVSVFKMTPKHPDLIDLKRQITEMQAAMQAMPPEVVSERQFTRNAKHAEIELLLTQATATGEALTRQTAASQSKIAQLNTESKRLFPVRAEYNKMEREIDQALRHLAFWEGHLNRVKMSLTAEDGNRGIQLNFIKPCGALSRPVSPDLTHVVMAALGMALLASAVSVLFAHRTNESFAGGEELAESVGVPLIGAVSEIISKQQRRIKRLRQCVIYPLNLAGMTAVLLVMTATLYLNLKRPETYHRILDDPGLFISEKMSADPGAGDQED